MFTGIIEALGQVQSIQKEGTSTTFRLSCSFAAELRPEESLSHDGVCLTVTNQDEEGYLVTAVEETLNRTRLAEWLIGSQINLERAMPAAGRFDGHMVQGHVDTVASVISIEDREGSWLLTFQVEAVWSHLLVDKGSACLNGVSLTVFNCTETTFQVTLIPYTWQHTNLSTLQPGGQVNIEFDIIAKYLWKWQHETGSKSRR